jgi:hypothetical protein
VEDVWFSVFDNFKKKLLAVGFWLLRMPCNSWFMVPGREPNGWVAAGPPKRHPWVEMC